MHQVKLQKGKIYQDYLILKELGQGSFGIVYEGLHSKNENHVAIKVISKQMKIECPKGFELFQAEVAILKKIKNPNVVNYIDYFEDAQACYLVIEFCDGGDLENYILKQQLKRLSENEALTYLKQLLNGFSALHQIHVIHRDIKLPNILMHKNCVKLADLGFAKELKSKQSLTTTILGTPYTMAPELLEEKHYGFEADMFSLGVIFYQMLTGRYPFQGINEMDLLTQIKTKIPIFNFPGLTISPQTQDLVCRMLKYKINERISWVDIYSHPCIKQQEQEGLGKLCQDIGYYNLSQSKIDLQKNQQIYQKLPTLKKEYSSENNVIELKPIMEIEDENNSYQQIQKQQQQNMDEEQESAMLLQNHNKKKQIEDQILKTMDLYFNHINCYKEMIIMIFNGHNLPDTAINTFYPIFFSLKKIHYQFSKLNTQLQKNDNIYKCQYKELFISEYYLSLKKQVAEIEEILSSYYIARKFDMEDLMKQTPDPNLIQEIENDYSQKTEEYFQQTLTNYYLSLMEDVDKNKVKNNYAAVQFQKHALEVIDCIQFEKFFFAPNFKLNEYKNLKQELTMDQRQKQIQERFAFCFP